MTCRLHGLSDTLRNRAQKLRVGRALGRGSDAARRQGQTHEPNIAPRWNRSLGLKPSCDAESTLCSAVPNRQGPGGGAGANVTTPRAAQLNLTSCLEPVNILGRLERKGLGALLEPVTAAAADLLPRRQGKTRSACSLKRRLRTASEHQGPARAWRPRGAGERDRLQHGGHDKAGDGKVVKPGAS